MLTKEKNRAITTRQVRDLNERETTIKTELTTILQAFLKSCTKKNMEVVKQTQANIDTERDTIKRTKLTEIKKC